MPDVQASEEAILMPYIGNGHGKALHGCAEVHRGSSFEIKGFFFKRIHKKIRNA